VVPKVGCTTPSGTARLSRGTLRGKGGGWRALEVGPSMRVVRLVKIEVTLDQALGNWYHFKPIHRIKHLLTVKYLLNAVSYFIVIIFLSGLCKPIF
jgi:hypothetical protein